ncbi:hypothetical protein GUITHDRAFT_116327 [Guillardia theta CCMP2712]|uniref:Uncharacterized protein n=1 Tax=Guillardia theta (strain CCMP2712) TaxID=905079 RepID=L1IML8_GUITC|nr:hypothetical protein GUITHDRAFT_116327 [Guillardia theta CCMP2712]EKX37518.1 hypothetical protein GUITHDRAFT_116327 [Guillardia theta CCMP2712]|eukprot:XP_005824498.1 hypothetical protein GUITHDRAFT_116327 [Guillardia theta CCMP2712]
MGGVIGKSRRSKASGVPAAPPRSSEQLAGEEKKLQDRKDHGPQPSLPVPVAARTAGSGGMKVADEAAAGSEENQLVACSGGLQHGGDEESFSDVRESRILKDGDGRREEGTEDETGEEALEEREKENHEERDGKRVERECDSKFKVDGLFMDDLKQVSMCSEHVEPKSGAALDTSTITCVNSEETLEGRHAGNPFPPAEERVEGKKSVSWETSSAGQKLYLSEVREDMIELMISNFEYLLPQRSLLDCEILTFATEDSANSCDLEDQLSSAGMEQKLHSNLENSLKVLVFESSITFPACLHTGQDDAMCWLSLSVDLLYLRSYLLLRELVDCNLLMPRNEEPQMSRQHSFQQLHQDLLLFMQTGSSNVFKRRDGGAGEFAVRLIWNDVKERSYFHARSHINILHSNRKSSKSQQDHPMKPCSLLPFLSYQVRPHPHILPIAFTDSLGGAKMFAAPFLHGYVALNEWMIHPTTRRAYCFEDDVVDKNKESDWAMSLLHISLQVIKVVRAVERM